MKKRHKAHTCVTFDCRHFKRKMGECHDLRVNARTVDASVVHRPKAVGSVAECA